MKNLNLAGQIVKVFGSQVEFATQLGIEETYVSRVVNRRRTPTDAQKSEWAKVLGCRVRDIFPAEG